MDAPLPTAIATLHARALSSTCCWYSDGMRGDTTLWTPLTYDASVPFITSIGDFPMWIDWCGSAWCDTATIPTTCGDETVKALSTTGACLSADGERCVTETMYEKYGDATPKLHKVFCNSAEYKAKTYYVEQPPSKRDGKIVSFSVLRL
jgi:hypothetical protein